MNVFIALKGSHFWFLFNHFPTQNVISAGYNILFLTIYPVFAIEISYIKMHWWVRPSTSDFFQTWLPSQPFLVFILLPAWDKLQNMKDRPIQYWDIFGP